MTQYIDLPIDSDPQDILADSYAYLQSVIPGWTPAVPNLDVWLLEAISSAAAELKDVASAVPTSIFRWFGANLANIPPVDATPATTTITVTVQDAAGYTIPNGTQVSIDKSGDVTIPFTVVGDRIIVPGNTVLAGIPITAAVAGADGSGLGSVGGVVHLLDPLTFVTTITQDAVTLNGVDAESDTDYLNRLASELQLLTPRPILPRDFAVLYRNIAGVFRATAIDGYNPLHNLLTANQASIETDATGWTAAGNTTLARSTAQAADGVASLSATATGAGAVAAILAAGAGYTPVIPGETITALGSSRAAVTPRSSYVQIDWLNAGLGVISSVVGAAANDATTGWTNYSVTGTAPALAAFVRIELVNTGLVAAEVHYWDKMSVRRGLTTDWVPGGTGETGQPRMVAVAGVDSAGAAVSGPVKAAGQAYLQAQREVNFVVNMVDPVITQIDVTYQVKALPGYDLPTLVTNINTALQGYLNPAAWGVQLGADVHDWTNTSSVRYLEVAAFINSVEGVDYITTTAGSYDLTIGIHGNPLARVDVALPGVAPLPTAGTLTGTAT